MIILLSKNPETLCFVVIYCCNDSAMNENTAMGTTFLLNCVIHVILSKKCMGSRSL